MFLWIWRRLVGADKLPPYLPAPESVDDPEPVDVFAEIDQAIREMPPPPQSRLCDDELRQIVAETEEPAIGLARIYPPDPSQTSKSYMGGLPRLPADVAWPDSPTEGRPRTFLMQIDCASLPWSNHQPWLPDSGTLWFFVEPYFGKYFGENRPDPDAHHVIWRDVDASDLPERTPPDGPPWWDGAWGKIDKFPGFGPVAFDDVDYLNHGLPSVLPHWPLETALVRSYSDNWNKSVSVDDDASKERPNLTPSDARPRMEQITFTSGEWTGLQQANAELLRDAWLDAFGLNEVKVPPLWHRSKPWDRRREEPLSWLALRSFCVTIRSRIEDSLRHVEPAVEAVRTLENVQTLLQDWLERAEDYPIYSLLPDPMKNAFLDALQAIEEPEEPIGPIRQSTLGMLLHDALHRSFNDAVWHPDLGPAAFSAATIENQGWQHRPVTRRFHYDRDNLDGPPDGFNEQYLFHRLRGAPTYVHHNEPSPDGYAMLAEIAYDPAMMLEPGDGNALQFWIRPEDLAARDFSGVWVTGGHGAPDVEMNRIASA